MVSLPYSMMYSQKHASNLTYPSTPWYSNYPSHHHPNNQFINTAPTGPNGILDSDSAAAASSFYNAHHHSHMLHSSSPDWDYNLSTTNSQFFSNGMTPPTSLHLSPTIQNHHHTTSSTGGGIGGGSRTTNSNDHLPSGLANSIPPSPPITVNSACSEMSSPGIGSNGNGGGSSGGSGGSGGGGGGVLGSGGVSPNLTSNGDLSRQKSPYGWLKKASYQNQPTAGKTRTKDKYRVVYTDYQRCELEKEYHMAHYITIRRKSELAQVLQLSERQVKIWFQNRRAKDRKQQKKRSSPVSSAALLSNGCGNVGIPMSHHHHHHHQMGNGPAGFSASAMYGLDIKPKLEPGLGSGHLSHGYGHLHQAHHNPMHHLSTMGMNFLHHSTASALPPPISSPPINTSIQSQGHLSS